MVCQASISHAPRVFRGVDFNDFENREVDVIVKMIQSCINSLSAFGAGNLNSTGLRDAFRNAHDTAVTAYDNAKYLRIRLRRTWDPRSYSNPALPIVIASLPLSPLLPDHIKCHQVPRCDGYISVRISSRTHVRFGGCSKLSHPCDGMLIETYFRNRDTILCPESLSS